jgi:hypothetical protein
VYGSKTADRRSLRLNTFVTSGRLAPKAVDPATAERLIMLRWWAPPSKTTVEPVENGLLAKNRTVFAMLDASAAAIDNNAKSKAGSIPSA